MIQDNQSSIKGCVNFKNAVYTQNRKSKTLARGVVIIENRIYAQITFYCGAELFKASYMSKQLFNAFYAAFESCVHGALKVAAPTVPGFRA